MDLISPLFVDGADPWVVRHTDGFLYEIGSCGGNRLAIRRASTLETLADAESVVVWTPPPGTAYSHELWAPELHFLDGVWWIYVAADDGKNENHRMWALENSAANPQTGDWSLHGPLDTKRWAIDGTILVENGQRYFIWSGWEGDENIAQHLYIAPLSDPITISGPRVRISTPDQTWEVLGCGNGLPTINEGPQVLQRGGQTHLIYSASGSWSDHYCLGRLSKRTDDDPLDPKSWTKHPEPVFMSTEEIVAPGHASFLSNPTDGDWIVYHTAKFPGAGWNRTVRAQRFIWDGDLPNFGRPLLVPIKK